jgi:hypothetical protein
MNQVVRHIDSVEGMGKGLSMEQVSFDDLYGRCPVSSTCPSGVADQDTHGVSLLE